MSPAEDIKQLIKKAKVAVNPEIKKVALEELVNEFKKTKVTGLAEKMPTLWRSIMESKVTRYSAAAVVVLAGALVLLSPFGTSKHGNIVWADVVEKVQQMRTLTYKEKRVVWEIGEEEPSGEADVMKYASEEYGYAEHQFDEKGKLMFRAYFLKNTNEFIIVFPAEKKYLRLSIPEEMFDRLTRMLTPRGLVDYCTSFQHTELGRSEFGNFDAEGFEIADPNMFPIPKPLSFAFPARDLIGRIWIDVETSLPVGIESEFNTDRGLLTGFKKLHGEFRGYDLRWDVEIPQGIFDPNIQEDYTELRVTDFIPAEAKAGAMGLGILPVGFVFWRRRRMKRAATQAN
jgi:hypothetical protein